MNRLSRFARAGLLLLSALWSLGSLTALAQPAVPNYQGLWWAAPAGSQSGWGMNLAHQGDIIFATWFTYGAQDAPVWYYMVAEKTADGVYTGALAQNKGPSYATTPFEPNVVVAAPLITSATLTFDSPTTGTVTYQPGSTVVVQPITMQVFGPVPTCVWGAQPDLSKATNYTDIWWASPPGSESGWGVNLTHQGTTIFATWFTYGGTAPGGSNSLWFSAVAPQTAPNTFSGTLSRTTGPAWGTLPYDSRIVSYTAVGEATFKFTDGNAGTFTFNVDGQFGSPSYQIKAITRQVFRPPGTVCETITR